MVIHSNGNIDDVDGMVWLTIEQPRKKERWSMKIFFLVTFRTIGIDICGIQ